MSVLEKPHSVPLQPPSVTTPSVRSHRRILEEALSALKAGLPAALLASARNVPGAKVVLSQLRKQIEDIEFEIHHNQGAVDAAREQDEAVHAAWRNAVHALPPSEAIEGITGGGCPTRCLPNVTNGCLLGGGCLGAGAECFHPHLRRELFQMVSPGVRMFPLRHHARASEVFDAACERLNLKGRFT